MSRWFRAAATAATAAAIALAPSACGTPETPAGTGGDAPHSGAVQLWSTTSDLGTVVIDADGKVAYRSDADTNQPPTSTCVDSCTQTWQPVLTNGEPVRPLGVEADKVGSITRPDGSEQVTLYGWPLYTHAGDGGGLTDTSANGTDGRWFAITPTGEKAGPGPSR